MVRQYVQVTDLQRQDLVRLIHNEGHSIASAAKLADIPYDNAKAINRTFLKERRVTKINYRQKHPGIAINTFTASNLKLNVQTLVEGGGYFG